MIELINQILQFRSFISRKDSGKLLKKMLSKVQFFQRNFSLKKWKRTKEKRRESITETDEISRRQRKKDSSLAKNWKGLGRRDATAAPPRKRRCREKVGFWSRRGERACRRRSGDRGTEGSRAVNCNKRESENFRKGKRGGKREHCGVRSPLGRNRPRGTRNGRPFHLLLPFLSS